MRFHSNARMIVRGCAAAALIGLAANVAPGAQRAAGKPSPPPVEPTPPAWHTSPSALDRLPSRPDVWDRIQDPLDRSTGRITDEQTYELDQLRQLRQEQLGLRPRSEFERFEEQHERDLRLEQRKLELQKQQQNFEQMTPAQRRAALDRREYELFINMGLSPLASQAYADQQALEQAQSNRNRLLIAADEWRRQQLQEHPQQQRQIQAEYHRRVDQIRADYEKQRERILGFGPASTPPESSATTQPSPSR